MIDVNGSRGQWLREMKSWRTEHLTRMGYDDAQYRRPELQWSQRNFVHVQMMVEDRYFYDPIAGKYTVDKYLDDLERRYGGVDSVLIWYVYPNIGVDHRNQTDLAADLPGGRAGLKQVVTDFHRRGVKVFLPTMPWDNGTRDSGRPDWEAIAQLAAEVGADGVNGDTYNGVPRKFREASDATGHPVIFQPEKPPQADEGLMWNNQSWGRASTEFIPAVSKLKWLESRHLVNVENRWARNRTDDFHYIFFNGLGLCELGKHLGNLESVHSPGCRNAPANRAHRAQVCRLAREFRLGALPSHSSDRSIRHAVSRHGDHLVDHRQPE